MKMARHMLIDEVVERMNERGYEVRIIPAARIREVIDTLDILNGQDMLHPDIYKILGKYFEGSTTDVPFQVRSVIVTASRCVTTNVYFNRMGRKVLLPIPPTYIECVKEPADMECLLNEMLAAHGYHVREAYDIPKKLIAVKCGLMRYGRNNIGYVQNMGSFALISAFYSDLPCSDSVWQEARLMEACSNCGACIKSCPTGALTDGRYLVKAERCITYHNEFVDSPEFPEWMDPASHNCIVGCMRCQICCPANKGYLKQAVAAEEFSDSETEMILNGESKENLPDETIAKLENLNLMVYYEKLARNIRVLLENKSFTT